MACIAAAVLAPGYGCNIFVVIDISAGGVCVISTAAQACAVIYSLNNSVVRNILGLLPGSCIISDALESLMACCNEVIVIDNPNALADDYIAFSLMQIPAPLEKIADSSLPWIVS